MTYTLARITDTEFELRNDTGNVLTTFSPPVKIPDDIIDYIIDDLGIGQPQKQAFKTLFTKDWKVIDER